MDLRTVAPSKLELAARADLGLHALIASAHFHERLTTDFCLVLRWDAPSTDRAFEGLVWRRSAALETFAQFRAELAAFFAECSHQDALAVLVLYADTLRTEKFVLGEGEREAMLRFALQCTAEVDAEIAEKADARRQAMPRTRLPRR